MLAAALEVLLVPLYAGKTLVPVTVVLAVLINIALPLLARSIVPRGSAAFAPFAVWLLVVVIIGLFPRPEGDVILPGGGALEWVGYGVLLGGTVAGTLTVAVSGARPVNRQPVNG
jgi:hypothetical protein